MSVPAARRASKRRVLAAGLFLLAATRAARSDLLPNDLSGDSPLTVTVRGAVGNHYRPGRPVLLQITIQNEGEPFVADVRVRESRVGGEAVFRDAGRVRLPRGASSHEILAAPAGGAAGTVLEVLRLLPGDHEVEGEPVFRGDLSRVLRPLGRDEELLVAAGVEAFPLPSGFRHTVMGPRELPASPEGYAAVSVVVLERVRREEISSRQAEALASFVRSGGSVVFASFKAMEPFGGAFFKGGAVPRTFDEWHDAVPGAYRWFRFPTIPEDSGFALGLGSVLVFAVEPGDHGRWRAARKRLLAWLDEALSARLARGGAGWPRSADVWIAPRAAEALAPERPFCRAADRAKAVALIGALAACVAIALLITRRRLVAAGALGGVAVLWAVVATITFGEPHGAARVVRVRALTSDGRAEIVIDTAVFAAFGEDARVGLESSMAPPLPVASREGELLAEPYVLAREGGEWRISGVRAGRGRPALIRSRTTRELDQHSCSLRTRALVHGGRVRLEWLRSGRRRLTFEGEEPPADIRHLIERFAPATQNLAWLWIEGKPDGVRLLPEGRIDPAPGSGTLVIAAAPANHRSPQGTVQPPLDGPGEPSGVDR